MRKVWLKIEYLEINNKNYYPNIIPIPNNNVKIRVENANFLRYGSSSFLSVILLISISSFIIVGNEITKINCQGLLYCNAIKTTSRIIADAIKIV